MSIPTRTELDALIRQRVADENFRDELLNDPRATVSRLVGVDLPDFIQVTVHEESLTDVHLVIPAVSDDEIHEDDLELVAGGLCWLNTGTCNQQCV